MEEAGLKESRTTKLSFIRKKERFGASWLSSNAVGKRRFSKASIVDPAKTHQNPSSLSWAVLIHLASEHGFGRRLHHAITRFGYFCDQGDM